MNTLTLEEVATSLREIREFMAATNDRSLSREEMADRLGISLSTLGRRIKSGDVPAPEKGRWRLSEVLRWERQSRAAS